MVTQCYFWATEGNPIALLGDAFATEEIGAASEDTKHLEAAAQAIERYDEYRAVLSPDGLVDEKWMGKAMEFILKDLETKQSISPKKVFDFSLSQEALAQVK
jgi:hypothetical protein